MPSSTSSKKACAQAPRNKTVISKKPNDWPLNWEIPDLTSDLCKGLSTCHPEIFRLLTSLGRPFIAKFLIALLAADGHFITLLLSTLWGLRGGFTTLCLQGIFGSGKTYCASMMLVVATSILGIPTLLTAEPNLPLYTAADTICDLLPNKPSKSKFLKIYLYNCVDRFSQNLSTEFAYIVRLFS